MPSYVSPKNNKIPSVTSSLSSPSSASSSSTSVWFVPSPTTFQKLDKTLIQRIYDENNIFEPATTSKYPIKESTVKKEFHEKILDFIAQWINTFVHLSRK